MRILLSYNLQQSKQQKWSFLALHIEWIKQYVHSQKHAVKSDDFSLPIYIQVFISIFRSNNRHNLCTLLVPFLSPLWILLNLWASSWIHAFASGNFIILIAFSEKTMERRIRGKTMSQASWTFCIRKRTYRVKKCRARIAKMKSSLRHSKSLIVWQH